MFMCLYIFLYSSMIRCTVVCVCVPHQLFEQELVSIRSTRTATIVAIVVVVVTVAIVATVIIE